MTRRLDWEGYPNARDLGGLPTRHGRTRYRRIARGPRTESLTTAGWSSAWEWGLRTVVDLRCPAEAGSQPGDPPVPPSVMERLIMVSAPTEDHDNEDFRRVCFPILNSPEYWIHHLSILPDLVCAALGAIATARPGILVHCGAGRDRTGMIVALLLANAEVPAEIIADDYAESVREMAGRATNSPTGDSQSSWTSHQAEKWIAQVRPIVCEFAEHVSRHLDAIGVSQQQRTQLRRLLTDPTSS